jgi:uncharacterized membrane protein (UPF0127 family)
MIRKTYILLVLLAIHLVGFTQYDTADSEILEKTVNIYQGENIIVRVAVEVADTPEKRERGLMLREKLGQKEGMLFVFPHEGLKIFWMKNTLIPLDIIFVSSNFKVASYVKDAPPCKINPCETYSSKYPARYALEVNAGFIDLYKITHDSKIEIVHGE